MSGAPATEYGVYHFRRTFELPAKPERFVVHVSGDNRYQLFVNGRRVAWGPARGGLFHWRYETVDAAPYLEPGKNVFAAVVWNFGKLAPEAQVTFETGFLVDGDTSAESVVSTGMNWKCARDESYSPVPAGEVRGYYAVGPGDRVAGPLHPWGWEGREFDDSRLAGSGGDWPGGRARSPRCPHALDAGGAAHSGDGRAAGAIAKDPARGRHSATGGVSRPAGTVRDPRPDSRYAAAGPDLSHHRVSRVDGERRQGCSDHAWVRGIALPAGR